MWWITGLAFKRWWSVPYMREHIDAGSHASLVVVSMLLWAYTKGMIPTHHDLVGLSVFAVISIVVGSDLPDIDARRAPISQMFQVRVLGTVVLVSPGEPGLRPRLPVALGQKGRQWLRPLPLAKAARVLVERDFRVIDAPAHSELLGAPAETASPPGPENTNKRMVAPMR